MKKNRAKIIEEATRLVWSSYESHLEYTHKKSPEGKRFHTRCVKEYSRLLTLLCDLY
jgi:hypothetical protein